MLAWASLPFKPCPCRRRGKSTRADNVIQDQRRGHRRTRPRATRYKRRNRAALVTSNPTPTTQKASAA